MKGFLDCRFFGTYLVRFLNDELNLNKCLDMFKAVKCLIGRIGKTLGSNLGW